MPVYGVLNLSLLHVPDTATLQQLGDSLTAPGKFNPLTTLPGCRLFLESHDDCYLYAEFRDESYATDLLAMLLHKYAEAWFARPVKPPSPAVCRRLLEVSGSYLSDYHLCQITYDTVQFGLWKRAFLDGHPPFRPDLILSIDRAFEQWTIVE